MSFLMRIVPQNGGTVMIPHSNFSESLKVQTRRGKRIFPHDQSSLSRRIFFGDRFMDNALTDDVAQLEYREVHRHNQAANQHAEYRHNQGFQQ